MLSPKASNISMARALYSLYQGGTIDFRIVDDMHTHACMLCVSRYSSRSVWAFVFKKAATGVPENRHWRFRPQTVFGVRLNGDKYGHCHHLTSIPKNLT